MFRVDDITDELIRAGSQGSAADRDRLVAALAPQVRGMVLVRLAPTVGQGDLVDDMAQLALTSVASELPNLRQHDVASLRSFVSVIVARRVADYLRIGSPSRDRDQLVRDALLASASGMERLEELLPAGVRTPSSAAARAEMTATVLAALAGLKQHHREVLTLAFFDQLSTTDAAERMKLTRSATSMLLMRAVRTLRRNLTGSSRIGDADDGSK